VLLGLLAGCATTQKEPNAMSHRLHHVVVIWLKQSGDADLRQRYINESKPLARLPGVLAYDVGTPASIKRRHTSSALDESYDVAIASVFESPQAFEAFLKNPEYGRIAQQVLRPWVDKYQVYDFVE
jgi:hypothetical protein